MNHCCRKALRPASVDSSALNGDEASREQEYRELGDGMRGPLALLLAGLATFTLMGFGQALIGPALTEMTRLFSLSPGSSGALVSAQWVGSAVGVTVMYLWSAHVTPRRALGMLALGATGLAVQPAWWVVIVSAVVFGTGYGMATAVFNPRVLRAFGARGASMLSLLNAAYAAGAIISPLAFVALGNTSRIAFGIAVVAYLAIWLFAGDRGGKGPTVHIPKTGFHFSWPILTFGAIGIGIEACLAGLGPTALVATGQSEEAAAQLLSAFFVAFLAIRILLGVSAHLFTAFYIYTAAMVWAVLASCAAIYWSPGPAFVAMGISAGMFFPGFFVTAIAKMGEDPRVTPVILGAGLVGGIGMPLALSLLTAGMGPLGFFWVMLAISLPTAAAALLLAPRMSRPD
jgi:FHS family glucose/mannose:H+ symporter-like MFS transporter